MTAVTLHPATTPAEHARLAGLAHTIWHEHYPAIIGVAQVNYMLTRGCSAEVLAAEQQAGTRFVLAYQHDTAIGLAATTPAGDEAWLDKLYVHANARGTGVARALYEDAAEFAQRTGAQRLRLRVNRENAGAIAAYRRLGFVVEAEDIKDIGHGYVMDDYLMSRPLRAARQISE